MYFRVIGALCYLRALGLFMPVLLEIEIGEFLLTEVLFRAVGASCAEDRCSRLDKIVRCKFAL